MAIIITNHVYGCSWEPTKNGALLCQALYARCYMTQCLSKKIDLGWGPGIKGTSRVISHSRCFSAKEHKVDRHLFLPMLWSVWGKQSISPLYYSGSLWYGGRVLPPHTLMLASICLLRLAAVLFAPCGLPSGVTGLWGEGRWGSKGSEWRQQIRRIQLGVFSLLDLSRSFNVVECLSLDRHFTINRAF